MIVRTAMVVDMGNGKEEYVDSKVYNVIRHEGYMQGRAEAIEEFRRYLKTVTPCELPQEMWDLGVDNTCDRMLRGERE